MFERHIEGPELDATIQSLPAIWAGEIDLSGQSVPIVPPTVRTAEVDPAGHLWVSLWLPFTYVYDPDGDKVRTVQFKGPERYPPIVSSSRAGIGCS
ncbi:MAG: hypothetical protein O3A25_13790 [Acidobacteria bacterium]|nr:hypothetical protein [Acidobacteriota bacterium]